MIRSGEYAIFKGKEYEIMKSDDGELMLLSQDPKDIKNGFTLDIDEYDDEVWFSKKVSRSDLETAYRVRPIAQYKNYTFGLLVDEQETYLLGINDASIAKELGMENVSQGEWHLRVKKEEVKVIERILPLWGFEPPTRNE